MFAPQYGESKGFMNTPHLFVDQHDQCVTGQCIDWRKLVHLLCLSDLLSTRRLGYSPLSPEDCIGLGASVREVIHMNPPRGFLPDSLRTKPHDLFVSDSIALLYFIVFYVNVFRPYIFYSHCCFLVEHCYLRK